MNTTLSYAMHGRSLRSSLWPQQWLRHCRRAFRTIGGAPGGDYRLDEGHGKKMERGGGEVSYLLAFNEYGVILGEATYMLGRVSYKFI